MFLTRVDSRLAMLAAAKQYLKTNYSFSRFQNRDFSIDIIVLDILLQPRRCPKYPESCFSPLWKSFRCGGVFVCAQQSRTRHLFTHTHIHTYTFCRLVSFQRLTKPQTVSEKMLESKQELLVTFIMLSVVEIHMFAAGRQSDGNGHARGVPLRPCCPDRELPANWSAFLCSQRKYFVFILSFSRNHHVHMNLCLSHASVLTSTASCRKSPGACGECTGSFQSGTGCRARLYRTHDFD